LSPATAIPKAAELLFEELLELPEELLAPPEELLELLPEELLELLEEPAVLLTATVAWLGEPIASPPVTLLKATPKDLPLPLPKIGTLICLPVVSPSAQVAVPCEVV
jgi:hypothetical protein